MSNDIELDVLSSSRPTEQTTEDAASAGPDITSNGEDQVVTLWAYVSTALLSSLAILMILFPGVLLFSAETPSEHRTTLTSLESYLALNGGIMLLAFSMALLFNIPSNEPIVETETQSSKGHPLLVPLTVACTVIAFLSYNTTTVSSLAFLIFLGAAIIGGWGWWTILFAGSSYRSRKTGADKRTSRFLFGNRSAASVQKKQWKKEQQAKAR